MWAVVFVFCFWIGAEEEAFAVVCIPCSFFIHMSSKWVYVMSCVCPADRLAGKKLSC